MRVLLCVGLLLPVGVVAQSMPAQPASAPAAVCGDGLLQEGEACDDGNRNHNDLCRNDCSVVTEWSPAPSELKSPDKALQLSLIGLVVPVVGPSLGHIYAQEYKRAASISTLRFTALTAATIGLGLAAVNCGFGGCDPEISIPLLGMAAVGATARVGLAAFAIADSKRAVLRYNASQYHPSKREEVLPFEAASRKEKAQRRAEGGGSPSQAPKWLYGGAATLGTAGLLLGFRSLAVSRDIRLDLEEAQSDGFLSLSESQSFAEIPQRQGKARALSIGADTLFVMAAPLGVAGALIQRKERQISKQQEAGEP
jgi:cysteine-rich repeat protein